MPAATGSILLQGGITEHILVLQVPQHELTTSERAYIDMGRRYPQLVVSTDFTKLVACWTQVLLLSTLA